MGNYYYQNNQTNTSNTNNENNENNEINEINENAPPVIQNNQINNINNIIHEENNNNENKINIENYNENSNNAENQNIQKDNENSDCPVPIGELNKYEKHFSFNNLMAKIKETAKRVGLKAIYMALLLYYALESPTLSVMDKAIIYGALGYFISPIDIIPDALPIIGFSDDIAVLAWAFNKIKDNITDLTREQAKTKLKVWFGTYNEKEIDDL